MRFTNSMKIAGEEAMRRVSEKALWFYDNTDPLAVYQYEDEDGNKLYAYDGCFSASGLTLEELQKDFEELADEVGYDE